MKEIKRVGNSGIHTVEGQVSGGRAAELAKQRDKEREEYESERAKIKMQNSTRVGDISSKFKGASDAAEQEFRNKTIGLKTASEFREARAMVDEAKKDQGHVSKEELIKLENTKREETLMKRDLKRKKMSASLSFADDVDEDEEEDVEDAVPVVLIKKKKNPHVDTSHLPDKKRDLQREQERERLRQEWLDEQDRVRKHKLQVVYSYWDGSGHRKEIIISKGTTIGEFLRKVRVNLHDGFRELQSATADQLMYIKEDLIIPHHVSFFDLIITKARGKSGPLFHFDVHDDVRITQDARVEKDESHPGKVVGRWWYEKNKHLFPASRWERFEPTEMRDGPYTVHGK
jgi:protein FAM50